MAAPSLETGARLHGRYVVKKELEAPAEQLRLLARDDQTGATVCILGFAAPGEGGREAYRQAVENAMDMSHPQLPRVLDAFAAGEREYVVQEHLEGVTLQSVLGMSVQALPERQILPWLVAVARTLQFLADRPRPFSLGSLDLTAIVLTAQEEIKLTDYGFLRSLASGVDVPYSAHEEVHRFGKLVVGLLGADPKLREVGEGLRAELLKLARRCQVPDTYPGFGELILDLEHLGAALADTRPATAAATRSGTASQLPESVASLLGLLLHPLVVGVGCAVATLVLVAALSNPAAGGRRQGPVAYVVGGGADLLGLDPQKHRSTFQLPLKNVAINDARSTANGHLLLLADGHNSRILFWDTDKNQYQLELTLDQQPQSMFLDAAQKMLYCTHTRSRFISVISLALQQVMNIVTLDDVPDGLAVSPDGSTLFVSLPKLNRVDAISTITGRAVKSAAVPGGPSALLISPDGRDLWVVSRKTESIAVLDVSDLTVSPPVKHVIGNLGGRGPIALHYGPDNLTVLALCQDSSNIAVIGATDLAVRDPLPTGGTRPVAWSFMPASATLLWVANSGSNTVGVVDPVGARLVKSVRVPERPVAIEVVP